MSTAGMTLLAAGFALAATGCKVPFPLYCDESTPCVDPGHFCDLHGDFEASGGRGRICIPTPFDAGDRFDAAMVDAAMVDAAMVDAGTADAGPMDQGTFDVTWSVDPGCGAGDILAEVIARIDGGPEYTERFDCTTGGATTSDLPAGDYTVRVDILDDQDALVARSTPQSVTLAADEVKPLAFHILRDAGFIAAAWQLVNEQDNEPMTCAEAGAVAVSILYFEVGNPTGYEDLFACEDGEGLTAPVHLGSYEAVISLQDESEVALGASTPQSFTLEWGHQTVDLGVFVFEIFQ
jgi:hypothetical protein